MYRLAGWIRLNHSFNEGRSCILNFRTEWLQWLVVFYFDDLKMAVCKLIRMISVLISFLLERQDKMRMWSVFSQRVMLCSISHCGLGWVSHWHITGERTGTIKGGFCCYLFLGCARCVCVCV